MVVLRYCNSAAIKIVKPVMCSCRRLIRWLESLYFPRWFDRIWVYFMRAILPSMCLYSLSLHSGFFVAVDFCICWVMKLSLCTSCRRVGQVSYCTGMWKVAVQHGPLTCWGGNTSMRWGNGPPADVVVLDQGRIYPGVDPRFIVYLIRSLVTIPTELPRLPYIDSCLWY